MTTSPSPRPPDEEPEGRLRPVGAGALTGWLVVGLVGGWLLRRAGTALDVVVPAVSWTQVLVLALAAAVLAGTAVATRRTVTAARADLDADRAVNRLVLARASAYVGALLAGGYAGHALSWLGASSQVADERLVRALVAALASAAVLAAALLLERACRARPGPPTT